MLEVSSKACRYMTKGMFPTDEAFILLLLDNGLGSLQGHGNEYFRRERLSTKFELVRMDCSEHGEGGKSDIK
jgi:hypothetical protein